jgi:SpoVK/Ycf46/Vps4 family AAA+-type ATPase
MALVNVQKTYTLNAIIANKEYTVKDVIDLLQVAKMQGVRISVKEAEKLRKTIEQSENSVKNTLESIEKMKAQLANLEA